MFYDKEKCGRKKLWPAPPSHCIEASFESIVRLMVAAYHRFYVLNKGNVSHVDSEFPLVRFFQYSLIALPATVSATADTTKAPTSALALA